MIMLRSRSNTCGAAWRSRSSRSVERGAVRGTISGEAIESRFAEGKACLKCTNTLVHLQQAVNEFVPQEETRDNQVDVAGQRSCHRSVRRHSLGFAGGSAAEVRDFA